MRENAKTHAIWSSEWMMGNTCTRTSTSAYKDPGYNQEDVRFHRDALQVHVEDVADDVDDQRHDQHRHRVLHRALHLLFELHARLGVGRESIENGIQDAAHLAGGADVVRGRGRVQRRDDRGPDHGLRQGLLRLRHRRGQAAGRSQRRGLLRGEQRGRH